LLRDRCKELGSQSALAADAGVSRAYLNDVVRSKRAVSDTIAVAVGYQRFVAFRKIGG
jgi:DNA-binding transcriptional regulator YdaS (Cro superfamily)